MVGPFTCIQNVMPIVGTVLYPVIPFINVTEMRVVQYSDKFMHGIVLLQYCLHITILYKSITIKNKAKQ